MHDASHHAVPSSRSRVRRMECRHRVIRILLGDHPQDGDCIRNRSRHRPGDIGEVTQRDYARPARPYHGRSDPGEHGVRRRPARGLLFMHGTTAAGTSSARTSWTAARNSTSSGGKGRRAGRMITRRRSRSSAAASTPQTGSRSLHRRWGPPSPIAPWWP
jgi:hypothetical protein